MIGTISFLMLLMWGLLIFAIARDDDIFKFIAGCGLLLLAVYTMPNGLEGVNNFVTQGMSVIQIGVGALAVLSPVASMWSDE